MANICKAVYHVLKWEGGFSNDIDDSGGATNKGVTLKTYQSVFGKDKSVADLKKITASQWLYIFKTLYYVPSGANKINNDSISLLVADMAWMSGVKTTVKKIQKLLDVEVDGIVGPITLSAINNNPDQKELFESIKQMRIEWLEEIAKKGNNKKFLKGWMNRLQDIKYVSK